MSSCFTKKYKDSFINEFESFHKGKGIVTQRTDNESIERSLGITLLFH